MVARILFVCGFALLPACVLAQTETADAPLSRADFNKLNANLTALTESINQIRANTTSELASLRREVDALRAAQDALIDQQKDQRTVLAQITMESEPGTYHVRLDTNSQSGRDELKRAIQSTIPKKGTFVIKNKTPDHQYVVVNDEEPRHIWPYGEERYEVQPGAVTSRVLGQQAYTWHVGVPEFKRVIELVDRAPAKIPSGY